MEIVRSMNLTLAGHTLYRSTFDEKTGAIVRVAYEPDRQYGGFPRGVEDEMDKRYKHRAYGGHGFSPVPETVDESITDKCHFGCTYCYQDSKPESEHAPKELVETILKGFDQPPYQIAIGGGEPTLHPDFPYILQTARELGTVPNYTTAGDKMSQRVIKATNEYCGGVAMTYYSFKGIDWFVEHYRKLRENLKVQVNVHLIANKDVAKNLQDFVERREVLGPLNLVLLAYYPEVGRATMDQLLTKQVYMRALPEAIKAAQKADFKIAFSEGMLPYFLSRPELKVNTSFAMPSEGRFSCYFDPRGRISDSSFQPPGDKKPTVYEQRSQEMWDGLWSYRGRPGGDACYGCDYNRQCSVPDQFHYLSCAFASHNQTSPKV
jgi:MoaA/NifB/PqqE/SkfB family radical SAM enzyme